MQLSDVPHALPAPVWAVIGGLLVAAVGWLFNRGKTKAETRKLNKEGDAVELESTIKAADTIMNLISKLRSMEQENDEKDRAIDELRAEIKKLRGNGRGHS